LEDVIHVVDDIVSDILVGMDLLGLAKASLVFEKDGGGLNVGGAKGLLRYLRAIHANE
jgi:hypothetical protein